MREGGQQGQGRQFDVCDLRPGNGHPNWSAGSVPSLENDVVAAKRLFYSSSEVTLTALEAAGIPEASLRRWAHS